VLPYCYNMTSNNGLNVLNATCVHWSNINSGGKRL